ncbi:hypothetical protein SGQ44_15865 [Flavobacterium sp. Fl-77]|uniref:Uncharacterized protein n=1 Tax=Flavobacterium flavipigmentatum TaxID=2893884 RepID=A0AAJ2SF38_9FLAO|nr:MULTISPECIES: hypothetical protein [unclassified Flavobacterium]MDX6183798.1 hypothetical protein [Flavobacterium sp. Fl-33]MDX6187241.1 hypothetical protein [Flavobacterium sp. Fl-77]UFH38056.1 hypothetical protein LNP22_15110 [Flavobacterium sp. F-70]
MKTKLNLNLFTANYFILCLVILLLNDFYLKYEFSNFITGKLSDFTCLFIFPYFISVFFSNKTKEIYIFTFLFFIFWKLEISEQFIKLISQITDFAFHRTVDLTDLIALSILPISYHYFHKKNQEQKENKNKNFALNSLIGVITIYSFLADTNPRQETKVKIKSEKEFTIQISKKQILNNLITSETNILETDSLFTITFDVPEYRAEATTKIRIIKADEKNTIFKIDSISEVLVTGRLFFGISQSNIDGCEKMNASEYEENFKTNCIDIITNVRKTEYPTYYAYKTE